MRRALVFLPVLGLAAAVGVWLWISDPPGSALDAAIARGEAHYAEHCASCHGARLEGQPAWKSPLPSGRLPAPPHDASGHTWHHPDGVLFRIVKEGPAAVVGGDYLSDMPGFADVLADEEIRSVLAFIKSTWPERERAYQAEMSRREREETR
jgi:mono/diheme cytochrome c family protein